MPRSGPRTVRRYSDEFKLAAVRLSQEPGIQVQTVAAALAIHPFMLSKWRTDAREGRLRGAALKPPTATQTRELARLQALEREYALLQAEHDLLKKAIRFCSTRRATFSPSSPASSSRTTRGEA
jgi:transposase